jgi:hypothetical protein
MTDRRKIEAHPSLWAVVVFHGRRKGVLSVWATKAEADRAAAAIGTQAFVLPPRGAGRG